MKDLIINIENLELEQKVKIYRKCIEKALSNDFLPNSTYLIEGISLSYNEVLKICNCIIDIYGNAKEISLYRTKYLFSNIKLSEFYIDIISHDRLKYIYEFRQKYGTDKEKCKIFARNMGITIVELKRLAKEYAVNYLCLTNDEYVLLYRKSSSNGKIKANLTYNMLFDLLLRFNDIDDVAALIEYSNLDLIALVNKIDLYVRLYHKDKSASEQKQLYINIKNKINMYKEYLASKDTTKELKKIKRDETVKKATEMVLEYINSDITFKNVIDYCRYKNISNQTFMYSISVVKRNNMQVYTMYREKSTENKKNGIRFEQEIAKIVANYILYGVSYCGGIRKFDLIDYYAITDAKIESVIKECIRMYGNPNNVFSKFLGVYKNNYNNIPYSSTFVPYNEIKCKKTDDGELIKGSGRIITDKEVRSIKEVFEKYNIPSYLYQVAIDRIKNDVLIEDVVNHEFISYKNYKLVKINKDR